mmetsp:Transcript_466/g.289  ORF Transcript_466/g.289 Transcript_466/m.289 type:complete len:191 (+) Transcript_466:169-741(+)
MKFKTVKELMVPLSEYATVSEYATLFEAVCALEKAQGEFDKNRYAHRAILVYDKKGRIIGKLSQLDILMTLEPKYEEIHGENNRIVRYGFSKQFISSMMKQYRMWSRPLDDICKNALSYKVSKFMPVLTEGEYVDENASLDEAIHQLILGVHQSLLVTRDDHIIGILRLTDVFNTIFTVMKYCKNEIDKT